MCHTLFEISTFYVFKNRLGVQNVPDYNSSLLHRKLTETCVVLSFCTTCTSKGNLCLETLHQRFSKGIILCTCRNS